MQKMTHRLTKELNRLYFNSHDKCVSCGYQFTEGDTSHLGYGIAGEPLYVRDACSSKILETAIRYRFSPRPYEVPEEQAQLWRYMDFAKYVSLLSSKKLFFARADQFADPFEGAKGVVGNKQVWDEHYLNFFRSSVKNPPAGY